MKETLAAKRWLLSDRVSCPLGLPQDKAFRREPINFATPTSPRFTASRTIVAPLDLVKRPPLETRQELEAALAQAARREPVAKLPDPDVARERIGGESSGDAMPNWMRAVAFFRFPDGGYASAIPAVEQGGKLEPALKARIFWTTARHNRAWYAVGTALQRYGRLGITADEVLALERESGTPDLPEALVAQFAEKLTVTPQLIDDADVAALREHFTDEEVAQIVYVVCTANMFDRLTEALQLPLDPVEVQN